MARVYLESQQPQQALEMVWETPGDFHSHGATPIAGWLIFIMDKLINMDDEWGFPIETPRIIWYLFLRSES